MKGGLAFRMQGYYAPRMGSLSSLLVMPVTDRVASLAAQLNPDIYSVLCTRNGEIETFTDFALPSSNPLGPLISVRCLLAPG